MLVPFNELYEILNEASVEELSTTKYLLGAMLNGQVPETNTGICGNIYGGLFSTFGAEQGFDCYRFIGVAVKYWPRASGDYWYPIPGGREEYEYSMQEGLLWQGKQLEWRQELCAFLVAVIDEYCAYIGAEHE